MTFRRFQKNHIASIAKSTFPSFGNTVKNPTYLEKRAILTPTLDVVYSINKYMSSLNHSEAKTYLSSNSACKSYANVDLLVDVHTPEFLNMIRYFGVPNHELNLKVGSPIMLLKNIIIQLPYAMVLECVLPNLRLAYWKQIQT